MNLYASTYSYPILYYSLVLIRSFILHTDSEPFLLFYMFDIVSIGRSKKTCVIEKPALLYRSSVRIAYHVFEGIHSSF